MPKMILRIVRPGEIESPDEEWEGPAELVAIGVDDDGVETECGRKHFSNEDDASEYLCSLLRRNKPHGKDNTVTNEHLENPRPIIESGE